MLIIGESLNAAIPSVGQAVAARDEAWIKALASRQVECGAEMLDVNAAGPACRDECAELVWMVNVVQDAVQVPFVLDSSNPKALRAAMEVYHGPRPLLSSITLEPGRLGSILSLAVKHDCSLVALCMGEKGIPVEPEERLEVAEALVERAVEAGISLEDLYLDPLVMTIAADYRSGARLFSTLPLLRDRFPQVHTICGVGNIGFQMPQRRLLNRTAVAMLMAFGLEAFMVDVRDRKLMATLTAARALAGQDEWNREYFKAYRAGKL
jgi:cobalamin-dependent methionine synthase I